MTLRTLALTTATLLALGASPGLADQQICWDLGQGRSDAALAAGADTKEVIKSYSNGVYVGQVFNGKRCGRGAYFFDSGAMQLGVYVDSKFRKGIKSWENGAVLMADYTPDGEIDGNGQTVRYLYSSGSMYKGQYINGERHGTGELLSNDDTTYYDGDFSNGKYHGQARYCSFKQGFHYHGTFANGKRHGEGSIGYDSGTGFEGVWDNTHVSFGFGRYKGESGQVFYYSDGQTQVRSGAKWCNNRGFSGNRCASEIRRLARLDEDGQATFPDPKKAMSWCKAGKAELTRERDALRTTVRMLRAKRP